MATAALRKGKQPLARVPAISPDGAADAIALVFEHIVVAAQMAVNDVIEMGVQPAGTILSALPILVCEDLDSSTGIVLNAGYITGQYLAALDDAGAARDCGAEFFSASTLGQAGGVATSTIAACLLGAPSLSDRPVGIKVATAATGTLTAGAKIRLILNVTPAPPNMAFA